MTDLRKAAEMALEALERTGTAGNYAKESIAIQALRQALAMENFSEVNQEIEEALKQPEQEPVAWLDSDGFPWSKEGMECRTTKDTYTPLYTAPPKREWVGLTDDEIHKIVYEQIEGQHPAAGFRVANCIEAKLKEKNHGRI
jgi:hypothetical protein